MALTDIALEMASLGRGLSPEHLLHRLTALTARLQPGCCAAAIALWSGGRLRHVSVSHLDLVALRSLPRSPAADPERRALAQRQAVVIPDTLASASREPYAAAAAALGIRSVVIQPVLAGLAGVTVGFYGARPFAFRDADLGFIARQAGLALQETALHAAG